MPLGFDNLVERLLYDVALAGTGGLGIKELGDAVREIYSKEAATGLTEQSSNDEDLLFSELPPETGPVVDDNFVELVWKWVSQNPEVTVEGEVPGPNAEIETRDQATGLLDKYRKQRLCTGEDRVWYAIAGHGIDHKRIPPLEFQALSVIAAQGPKGVLQPDVTKLTGQDKRSLPKRTDNLTKNGYIVKTTVIARGTKTSLLKLKKFAGDTDMSKDEGAPPGTVIIQYNLWFDESMRLLKENDNIMAFEDLRIGLGINKKKFETRALHRCVRRLCNVGCLRKVTARVEPPASMPDAEMKSVRSLQLLREPTDIDRIAFMRSDWQRSKLLDSAQIAQYAHLGTTQEDEEDDMDVEATEDADGEPENPKRILNRSPPVWSPDLPFPNFLYNRIKEAGARGTSSGELYEESVGHFWKRAMDEMLVKLTDLWQFSQPPHLRHLSIVKDTGQRGKQPTFQYRTHGNFVKAVEMGEAFWEGVFGPDEKGKGKPSKKKAEAAASARPDLDAWGFPKLSKKEFVGQNGLATLDECRRNANIKMPSMSTLLRPGYAKRQSDAIVGTSVLQFGTPKKSSSTARTPASQARRKKPGQRKVAVQESPNLDDESSVSTKTPATLKRSAVEANLDDEQAPLSTKEPRLDTVSDEQTATGSERLLGSLNQDERTEIMSPTTPAPQEESTIIEPASFSAAFPKKRGRPSKATLAERAGETASPSTPATKKVARPKKKPFSSVRAPGTELEDGVHINPPGAWELKKHVTQPRGRPPKAKIAVFKLSRLHDFPWYTADVPSPPAKSPEQALRKSLSASRSPSSTEPPPATEHEEPSNTQAVTHDSLPRIQATQEEPENVVDDTNKPPQEDQPAATFNENAPPQDSTEELNLTATSAEGVAPPDDKSDPSQQNIEKDDPVDDNLPDITVDSMSDHNGPSKKYKKAGVTKGFGALPIMRRNIVLDIIRSCGGIFPGKGEIWFPFATFWQRKHKQTPDRHTVDNVVKGIISSGRIKKLTFFFKSRKGLTVERAIFAEPGIDPNSPQVKQLQKRIIDNFPATVLPEEADVSPELRRQAARNSQITNLAKLAKQGSGISSPAPSVQAGAQQPASHYIRDQFPQDTTLTVKRVGHPSGLGATDAALASIKRSKQLNRVRKAGRKRQYGNVYLDDEDGIGEMTFEQAMLQGEQDLFGQRYKRSAASSRLARMRGSAAGARRLPGRILASKSARRDPNALAIATGIRTRSLPWNAIGYVASQSAHSKVEPAFRAISTGTRTTRSLPWNALGYVPSQSAHSKVTPDFKAITTQTLVLPKRAGRIQWQWADPSLADWSVQPSNGAMSGLYSNESSSFGLLLPNDAQIVHGDYFDVQRAPQNLNEIVNSHWLPSSPYADDEANEATRFFDEVDRVEAWERRLIKARQGLVRGSDRPFINYTTPAITSQPYIGRYLPGMQMNTLSGRRKRAGLYGIEDVPSPKRVRLAPARRLLSETDPRKYKKRDRRAAARFTEKDYDRLAKAIALVSVVAGGLSYRRNWYITAHALRYRFEPEFLRHRWEKIRDQRNPVVKQMQAQIWEPFLDAYERGVLPRVDFETLENTDWPALMDWVHTEVAMSPMDNTKSAAIFNKVPELPATEQELQSDFKITELEAPSVSREEAFTAVVDKRRRDVVLSCVNGVALESEKPQEIDHKANELLRSWTRAIVLTNDKSYNQLEAYNKITKFGDKALDATIRDLCAEKILQAKKKGRRLPGRNLKLDETAVLTMFKRWSDKQGPEHLFLTRVAERREEVLEVLRHQDHYDLAYSAEDELYIVLTNMVGQGLLKVRSKLPERNDDFDAPFPKLTAWGYSGYNYNVRTFDKTRLRFSIVYEKTDKFTFEHGLRTDIPLPTEPPLFPGEDEPRIPLWVDIHGELLPRMWEMVLRSVLYLVVFRPGIDSAGIQEAHRSKLWSWEIEVMMKWMEETGLAERAGPGREINGLWKGGWKANAWWYCALCPDVAKWPALNEWAEEFSVPT